MSEVHYINPKIRDKRVRPPQTPLTEHEHSPGNVTARPVIGISEWFRPGEHDRVEQVLADCKALGIAELRTGISWADWHTAEGMEWYLWLLQRLAREVTILPCVTATPPLLSLSRNSSSRRGGPRGFAGFIGGVGTGGG
jgi:CDP-paratose 2-epimerase